MSQIERGEKLNPYPASDRPVPPSPRPWNVVRLLGDYGQDVWDVHDVDGTYVLCCGDSPEAEANADLIVSAVNHAQEAETLRAALEEAVQLQSHYAALLNMHDGGERLTFTSAQEWMNRLAALAGASAQPPETTTQKEPPV